MYLKSQKVIIIFTILVLVLTFIYSGCENKSTKVIPITSISLSQQELTLFPEQSDSLYVIIEPENATNKDIVWSSSDDEIVIVTQDGVLSAISVGDAIITVTSKDGNHEAICIVTVTEEDRPVTGVSLNYQSLIIEVGHYETLHATIEPADATNQNVTWISSDETIASVSIEGVVSAIAPGVATINVTTEDGGFSGSCEVTTNISVTSVSLNRQSISLCIGGTETLLATIMPDNATNQNITWSNSDPSVASLVDDVVTAISLGSTTMTVISEDGGFKTTCQVYVYTSDTFFVANAVDWENAVNYIQQDNINSSYTIAIIDDFSLPGSRPYYDLTFGNRENIEVIISGNHTITLDLNSTGALLGVYRFQTITLVDVALQGHLGNTLYLVYVGVTYNYDNRGRLKMKGNASISNNRGGGVYVLGIFEMEDNSSIYGITPRNDDVSFYAVYHNYTYRYPDSFTKLSGNSSICNNTVGGVYSSGSFFMTDNSSIYGNTNLHEGGGVFLYSAGRETRTVSFSGNASIYDNHSSLVGGGIYSDASYFTISDNVSIHGNSATAGGGIFLEYRIPQLNNRSEMTLSGGIIYGNEESGSPSNKANVAQNQGASIFRGYEWPNIAKYGDGANIFPHLDGYIHYTDFTVEGRE